MQRRSAEGDEVDLRTAESAVALALTDPHQAAALADAGRRRAVGPEARAVACRAAGLVAVARGDLSTANRLLRQAIQVADRAALPRRAAEARASLSYVLTLTGDTAAALAEVDRAAGVLRGVVAGQLLMQRALILTELGRFPEAETGFAGALRALRRAGGSDLVEGDVYVNRSQLHARRRHWRAAEDDLAAAANLYLRAGHGGRLALVEHSRGSTAVTRGDLPAAFAHFDEAEKRYREQDRHSGLLPVERADALLSVRLVAEARAAAEHAVATFARQRNAVDLVQARLVLAHAALAGGDPSTARTEADLARRSAARQQRPGWAALAGYVALRARWDGGERDLGMLAAARRALRALDGTGWVVAVADTRILMARLLLDLGRPGQARHHLRQAAGTRQSGPAELRARAWHAEALLRLASGDHHGAAAALGSGMDVLDRFRSSLGATELRTHVASAGADLAQQGMSLALQAARAPDVFRWAERWRAGALLLRPAQPPEHAALAAHLAELRDVTRLTWEAAASGRDPAALLARQAALERSVRRLSRHAPGASATAVGIPSLTALRSALGTTVLAEFVIHDGQLWVVIVGDRVTLRALGPVGDVTADIEALRFGLRRLAYGIGSPSSLDAAEAMAERSALDLDRRLLVPIDLGAGAERRPLVVVPTGPLHGLRWGLLPSCTGRPVSVAPSAALWFRVAEASSPAGGRRVFVAGPGLAHAATEVAALCRSTPDGLRFTGRRARVVDVTAAFDGAELAHVAAHGRLRADNPLFTALELADGPLTVFDLERLRHPPLHVVLSACDSGTASVHPGDELIGLATALLAMGTRSLVASLIPVPDDATVHVMLALHRRLRRGEGPAQALAGAQMESSGPGSTRRDRVAAAGFVCLGAG